MDPVLCRALRAPSTETVMRLSFIFAALLYLSLPVWASVSLYMDPDAVAERSSLVVEATVVRTASGYDRFWRRNV